MVTPIVGGVTSREDGLLHNAHKRLVFEFIPALAGQLWPVTRKRWPAPRNLRRPRVSRHCGRKLLARNMVRKRLETLRIGRVRVTGILFVFGGFNNLVLLAEAGQRDDVLRILLLSALVIYDSGMFWSAISAERVHRWAKSTLGISAEPCLRRNNWQPEGTEQAVSRAFSSRQPANVLARHLGCFAQSRRAGDTWINDGEVAT